MNPKSKDRLFSLSFFIPFLMVMLGIYLWSWEIAVGGFVIVLPIMHFSPRMQLTMFVKKTDLPLDYIDISLKENNKGDVNYELGVFSGDKKVYRRKFSSLSDAEFFKKEIEPMLPYTRGCK
jgi:hypothetical protein